MTYWPLWLVLAFAVVGLTWACFFAGPCRGCVKCRPNPPHNQGNG